MITLIPPNLIQVNSSTLNQIDREPKSIYRAITFCKKTSSKALLDNFVNSIDSLTELLSIKNAQMEVETEDEREISPESHQLHPNKYRNKLVQIGGYLCPNPDEINNLMTQLFYNFNQIINTRN